MERIITIDNQEVTFKSTGATPLRYRSQFGKDFFADLMKLSELENLANKKKKVDYSQIDFETFYNLAWVLAKTADKSIPEPMEWLDKFEEFPIIEIIPELQDLLLATIQSQKK